MPMLMTMTPAAMPIISHKLICNGANGFAGGAEGVGCTIGGTAGVAGITGSTTEGSAGASEGIACSSGGASGASDGVGCTSDGSADTSLTKNVPDRPLTFTA